MEKMILRHIHHVAFTVALIAIINSSAFAQCLNTVKFPASLQNAPAYQNFIKEISNVNFAGDYFQITNLQNGRIYQVNSSAEPKDWLTVYDQAGSLVAEGLSPLSLPAATSSDTLAVHINTFPSCGSQNSNRTSTIECLDCPSANNVGIGVDVPDPSSILDISSTTQGLGLPRMLTFQRDAIIDPADGLLIYNNSQRTLNVFDNTDGWKKVTSNTETSSKIITLSAYDFQPDRGGNAYVTNSSGRMGDVTKSAIFIAPINLPVGSRISAIRYYYLDNFSGSTGYVELKLVSQSLSTSSNTEYFLHDSNGELSSSNTKNKSVTESNPLTISSSRAYYLSFKTSFNTGNSDLRIKGAVITYSNF